MGSEVAEDDLMQKADALMRRHRVFVAGVAENAATAEAPLPEDVPVLTEVVSPDTVLAAVPPIQTSVDIAALRGALAFELETWLDEELPQHVMRVLDGVTDQLIAQLSLKARSDLLPRLQGILKSAEAAARPASTDD